MEDSWRAKCGSTSSSSSSSFSWSLPMASAAAGSIGQVEMNSRQPFNGFYVQDSLFKSLREAFSEDQCLSQEKLSFGTVNPDFYRLEKIETDSPFFTLLSCNLSQLPTSRLALSKPHQSNDEAVQNVAFPGQPMTTLPPLLQSHQNNSSGSWNALSSIAVSRPYKSSAFAKPPVIQRSRQVVASHNVSVDKVAFKQTSSGQPGNDEVNDWHQCPMSSLPGNSRSHHNLGVEATQEILFQSDQFVLHSSSPLHKGSPRVFCRNTVGHLFMDKNGLIGVICFCHRFPMSVAKFCEHSGVISANPADVVCLENGVTVLQWSKQCLGVLTPGNNWDWSQDSSVNSDVLSSKTFNGPALLNKMGLPCKNTKVSVGSWKSREPLPVSIHGPTEPGQSKPDKTVGKELCSRYERYNSAGCNLYAENFCLPTQVNMSPVITSNTLQAVIEAPISLHHEKVHSTVRKGKDTLGQHPKEKYVGCVEKDAIPFSSIARSAYLPEKHGGSSNIELRLGQPCQNSHTFSGYPESILQFGTSCSSQKVQFQKQPSEGSKHIMQFAVDKSKHARKSKANFQVNHSEVSGSNRADLLSSPKTVDVVNTTEASELKNDAMKNSLISLFLSHLERNKSTHSLDNVFCNEDSRVPSNEALPVKSNVSRSSDDLTNDFTEKSTSILDFSKNKIVKKSHQPIDNIGVKPNYVVIIDQVAETKNTAPSISLNCSSNSALVDHSCQSSLLEQTPVGLSKLYSWSSSRFGDHFDHIASDSDSRGPNTIERPSNLGTNIPCSSAKAIYSLEPISSWTHFNASHEETVKTVSSNHMVDLHKEKLTENFEARLPNRGVCCHSSLQFQPNVYSNDLALEMELREGSHCSNHHDFSKLAMTAVSSRPKYYSGCGADGLAGQPSKKGLSRCCYCSASIQRLQCDSEDAELKDSACQICGACWQPCLSARRGLNNSIADGFVYEPCNQRERNSYFCGKCYSMQNCASDSYISGGNGTVNVSTEQRIQGQVKMKYISSDYPRDYSTPDFKRTRLGHCNCLNSTLKDDNQTVHWRDVPEQACAQSSAADKLAKAFETSKVSVAQAIDSALKHCVKSNQESKSVGADLTFNGSIGSSAPVATEESSETKRLTCHTVSTEITSSNCDFVVDEGSENEKCGSSDEAVCGNKENCTKFSSNCLHSCSVGNDIGEVHPRNPAKLKRAKFATGQNSAGEENNNKKQKVGILSETRNVNKNLGDKSIPESDFSAINLELRDHTKSLKNCPSPGKGNEDSEEPENIMNNECLVSCPSVTVKRKRTAMSSTKLNFSKKTENLQKALPNDDMQPLELNYSLKKLESSDEKTITKDIVVESKMKMSIDAEKPPKYMSLNSILNTPNNKITSFPKKAMPIVCGNSGIIYNEKSQQRLVKMVSLKSILDKPIQCHNTNIRERQDQTKQPKTEACRFTNNSKSLSSKNLGPDKQSCSMSEIRKSPRIFNKSGRSDVPRNCGISNGTATLAKTSEPSLLPETEKSILNTSSSNTNTQEESPTCLGENDTYCNENTDKEYMGPKDNIYISTVPMANSLESNETATRQRGQQIHSKESLVCAYPTNGISIANSKDNHRSAGNLSILSKERHIEEKSLCFERSASCCVCGSAKPDIKNKLIDCSTCFIRVHQACYGVSKIPKGVWQCRPCKINSHNIVCVLCGYDGGAMTRALKSQNIVKSLLRARKVSTKSNTVKQVPVPDTLMDKVSKLSTIEASEYKQSGQPPFVDLINSEHFIRLATKMELQNQALVTRSQQRDQGNHHAFNSIVAGLLDPSIFQWVHMVCGLWTPGTRCPNNDTMSAFDVSAASPAKRNTVCSLCNQAGGSYIKCRVQICSTLFHPWCAHQKELLQSEIEGADNDKVGFYGTCLQHATNIGVHCDTYIANPEGCIDWTCSRAEGFKGRKREKKYQPSTKKSSRGENIVSQEQINAWLHINRPKSYKGVLKHSSSEVEHDFRKEYARYKQSKAWKHLTVYKSGIHALGLYTSQFIARGAMVVEYVGEIVGLRVADKREIEYQSGRRIQYKSACYFFKIDKEHIIDATRKGGIAHFVNHCCMPNCVAKIISIKNEKKVAFFAERDINPGEEITYDYHFNREEEVAKIPCLCNSKNCRQFLN